jgi:uncharacterized phage protein (TIGR01671 family)
MREILFRGKNGNEEWVQGDLLQNGYDYDFAILEKENKLVTAVIDETVGQFAGLTDKNGKKIFEGDIVKINLYKPKGLANYEIGYIKYDYFKTRFVFCTDEGDYGIEITWAFEVIGNIHDNPELLKGGVE